MYTEDDFTQVKSILKKRWWITAAPAAVILLAAIAVFVAGRIARSGQMWMVTAALTVLGGVYFLFFYGVYVRPVLLYKNHVNYMLNGRKRETTGIFKAFSDDVSDKDGIHPMPVLNKILSILINAFRSVPFIILMVAMLPVAKFIVGTSLGNKAVIVTLVIAAAPYVARMVESSIKEVDKGVIEAAEAMGTPRFQIITKVLVPEAKPSLITGAVISMVTVLGYSAMAATIGGTGLGQIAIVYGHQRFNQDIIWFAALLCIIIVQVIQEVGMYIVRKTDKRTSA